MRKLTYVTLVLALIGFVVFNVDAYQRTKGYLKKNGTYVAPHYKTSSDKSKMDNWSTKGNVNPTTGKKGTVNPSGIKSKKHKKISKSGHL